MQNNARIFVKIIKDYCVRFGIDIQVFSQEWFIVLRKGDKQWTIFGYDLGLNNSTALLISNDKNATSELLRHTGIPSVEHKIFHAPLMADYIPMTGNWADLMAYFDANNQDVVCKPTIGTGGINVNRVRSTSQLERVVHGMFEIHRSICLSPFLEIERECRVIVLDSDCVLTYEKKRQVLVGDGQTRVLDLLVSRISDAGRFNKLFEIEGIAAQLGDLTRVPAQGEAVPVNWKHNLAGGGCPILLDESDSRVTEIRSLALRAAQAIGVVFAAIDIVEVQGRLLVIEVNSGVMMEHFARCSKEHYAIAETIYGRALALALATGRP